MIKKISDDSLKYKLVYKQLKAIIILFHSLTANKFHLKGHKQSLVLLWFNVVNLYYINEVLMNHGRLQKNPAVRVSKYCHDKHIIDLHQFTNKWL